MLTKKKILTALLVIVSLIITEAMLLLTAQVENNISGVAIYGLILTCLWTSTSYAVYKV